jgi:hypothetical protein
MKSGNVSDLARLALRREYDLRVAIGTAHFGTTRDAVSVGKPDRSEGAFA